MPHEVQIGVPPEPGGGGVAVGGMRVPVFTGPAGGGDAVYLQSRPGGYAAEELARIRSIRRLPLLVECRDGAECAQAAAYADAVVVETSWLGGGSLLDAVLECGLPVVVRRAPGGAVDRWLEAGEHCAAIGRAGVILCEGGGELTAGAQPVWARAGTSPGTRTGTETGVRTAAGQAAGGGVSARAAPELAVLQLARGRHRRPVLVDVGAAGELVGSAVVAGADGVVTAPDATADQAARAAELATTLAPFGRAAQPGTIDAARQAIDQVDASLANLLESRTALAALVQRLKPVGGFAGRDREREQQLVAAMARRAPQLGLARIRRIMAVVIEAGLDLAERVCPDDEPADATTAAGSARPGDPSGARGRGAADQDARSAS